MTASGVYCADDPAPAHTVIESQPGSDRWSGYFDKHAIDIDSDWCYSRLVRFKERMLGEISDFRSIAFNYVERGPKNSRITSEKDVESFFDTAMRIGQDTFLVIQPRHSFTKLPICEEILWKLINCLCIFPGIFDVLHLFGEKIDEVNEDYPVYHQQINSNVAYDHGHDGSQSGDVMELCYNFKYVEQRKSCSDSGGIIWTTRKIAVYAKTELATARTTWILIQPGPVSFIDPVTKSLQRFSAGGHHPHELQIHLLFMRCASRNWTQYINDLEAEFRELDNRVFMWRPDVTKQFYPEEDEKKAELEMPETQRIQRYKVKLHQLSHALDINCSNIESLRRGMAEFQRLAGGESSRDFRGQQYRKYDRELEELCIQTMQHKTRVKNLIRCVEGLFSLVCTLIPYMFARRESNLLLKLSSKATQYAKSMKVITLVCMVYLPPSLIAGVFGMMNLADKKRLALGPMAAIFLAATGILLLITWILWAWWERRGPRKEDEETSMKKE